MYFGITSHLNHTVKLRWEKAVILAELSRLLLEQREVCFPYEDAVMLLQQSATVSCQPKTRESEL